MFLTIYTIAIVFTLIFQSVAIQSTPELFEEYDTNIIILLVIGLSIFWPVYWGIILWETWKH